MTSKPQCGICIPEWVMVLLPCPRAVLASAIFHAEGGVLAAMPNTAALLSTRNVACVTGALAF